MDKELQQALAALVGKTVGAVEKGAEFMVAQLPDVIQQLLRWKLVESMLWCGFGLAMVIAGLLCFRLILKGRMEEAEVPLFGASVVLAGVGGLVFLTNFTWLQIWLAPKVYLIEYAAHLAK